MCRELPANVSALSEPVLLDQEGRPQEPVPLYARPHTTGIPASKSFKVAQEFPFMGQ